jgi:MFS family permease
MFKIDDAKNNLKNVAHAFFLSLAITIAEPSTILPLMVHHFSQSNFLVGLYASLLRGGAIVIQLYASFHAQSYKRVIPYLRKVFFFRFLSWFSIGLSIYLFGERYPTLTVTLIGVGLFFFSFTAGFGAIYFKELQAKLFSKEYRGKTMANRSIAGSIASIISGGVTGYVLSNFEAPDSYAYLFLVSSIFMGIGFILFGTINEPPKENVLKKEKSFKEFIKNATKILKSDKRLKLQTLSIFLSFGYLIAMPFVILKANSSFELNGWMLGGFISVQMVGSIIGSTFLWRRISNYDFMLQLAISIMILAFTIAIFAESIYGYLTIFLLFGVAIDGLSISAMNLVIEISPEDKRPIYTALQTNLSSIGLFFPILGAGILKVFNNNYTILYITTIITMVFALYITSIYPKDVESQNNKI